jgi:hypothetical protein
VGHPDGESPLTWAVDLACCGGGPRPNERHAAAVGTRLRRAEKKTKMSRVSMGALTVVLSALAGVGVGTVVAILILWF